MLFRSNQMEDEDDVFDPVEEKDENGEYKLLDSGCENGLLYNIYQQEGENGDKYACITGYSEDIGSDISVPTHIKGAPVTQLEEGAFNKCENLKSITVPECQTAHCGRGKSHFIFVGLASPIVPYRNLKQTTDGITADCRSLV